MKYAEHVLRMWNKQISNYDRISFDDAQIMYMNMCEIDGKAKEYFRQKLINGTLYLIPKFINKSILPYIKGNSYDMNDIISVCNEVWINFIDSGKLLEVSFFSELFDVDFYIGISLKLSFHYNLYNDLFVNNDFFVNALAWYINQSINGEKNDYDSFLDYLNCYMKKYDDKSYNILPCRDVTGVFNLIVEICNYLIKNGFVNKQISVRQIRYLKDLLLENVLCNNSGSKNIVIDDYFCLYSKMVLEKQILNMVFNDLNLSKKEKEILRLRYGLDDGHFKVEKAVGDYFGITRAGVDISIKRTMKRIKERGKDVIPLIDEYLND